MTAHAYTEDQLVEQPAIGLFAELRRQTVSAMEEVFGAAPHPSPLPKGEGGGLGESSSERLTARLQKRSAVRAPVRSLCGRGQERLLCGKLSVVHDAGNRQRASQLP